MTYKCRYHPTANTQEFYIVGDPLLLRSAVQKFECNKSGNETCESVNSLDIRNTESGIKLVDT